MTERDPSTFAELVATDSCADQLPRAAARDTVVRALDVAKAFGPTQALRSASLELHAGEVHCIVGENGSGKSTLVKILAGVHRPDSGRLEIADRAADHLPTPKAALAAGIATVFQEVLVVEPRSVLENVSLGIDGILRTGAPDERRRARTQELLEALMEHPPPLDLPIEALTLPGRQACCIARALIREPRVLILDEATSALDVETRDRLFVLLRRIVAQGTSVIFISHRMDEIGEIGDRTTVMRSGETVATLERGSTSAAELVRLMTGSAHRTPDAVRARVAATEPGEVVLRGRHVCLRPGARAFDVDVRAGELVGVAGLEGHGQDAFLQAMCGAFPVEGEISRLDGGQEHHIPSQRAAAEFGIVYVPRERRAESLFSSKSIIENFAMATLARDARGGLLRPRSAHERLASYVHRLGIKLQRDEDPITSLSGGNQQKVVIARWLATEPRVLLLNDPTRGVDLGAKQDLYRLLGELAAQGVAVVMLSTEIDEHVELMDRVIVFREFELSAELPRHQLTRTSLVAAFFGERSDA